jgi:prepilin-type N-terminal cleavage/methylation domain-containing protein
MPTPRFEAPPHDPGAITDSAAVDLAACRAFTLIEVMVVVAMLSIIAALAVPELQPEVKKAQLEGAADSIAAFISAARTDAITSRRCVRIRIVSTARPHRLVAEALNTRDCDMDPESAPRIVNPAADGGQTNLWLPLRDLPLPAAAMTVEFDPAPSDSSAVNVAAGSTSGDELRWRATGRIFSANTLVNDDDAAFRITHERLAAPGNVKFVVAESQGLICTVPRGDVPRVGGAGGIANNLECP